MTRKLNQIVFAKCQRNLGYFKSPRYWTYDFAEVFSLKCELLMRQKDFSEFKKVYRDLKACPFPNIISSVEKVAKDEKKEWILMS